MSGVRPQGLWSRAGQRFLRDRAGLLATAVVLVYLLVALSVWLGLAGQDWGVLGAQSFAPVSAEHWFGTTRNGQDIFARAIYSTRTAFEIGLVVAVSSVVLGAVFGALSGFSPGRGSMKPSSGSRVYSTQSPFSCSWWRWPTPCRAIRWPCTSR